MNVFVPPNAVIKESEILVGNIYINTNRESSYFGNVYQCVKITGCGGMQTEGLKFLVHMETGLTFCRAEQVDEFDALVDITDKVSLTTQNIIDGEFNG